MKAYGAMLELKQRKEGILAMYARRARRVAEHIGTGRSCLFAIKFLDGFGGGSLRRRLSICDAAGKTSFELVYKRFMDRDRSSKRNRRSGTSAPVF